MYEELKKVDYEPAYQKIKNELEEADKKDTAYLMTDEEGNINLIGDENKIEVDHSNDEYELLFKIPISVAKKYNIEGEVKNNIVYITKKYKGVILSSFKTTSMAASIYSILEMFYDYSNGYPADFSKIKQKEILESLENPKNAIKFYRICQVMFDLSDEMMEALDGINAFENVAKIFRYWPELPNMVNDFFRTKQDDKK